MEVNTITRRRAILAGGLGLTSSVSGCTRRSNTTTETDDTPTHEAVRKSDVFLGADISADLPTYVSIADSAKTADVAIVASDTSISGESVVERLVNGVPTGVYGEPALTRLAELLGEGDVANHFERDSVTAGDGTHDVAVFQPLDGELSSYLSTIEGREPVLVDVLDRVLAWISQNEASQES